MVEGVNELKGLKVEWLKGTFIVILRLDPRIAKSNAGGGPETSSGRRKLQFHAELDSASQGRG